MTLFRIFHTFSAIILAVFPLFAFNLTSAQAAAANCTSSGPASNAYTVDVCITSPADSGATLSGDSTITATAAVTGKGGVQRMVFYLNGAYLLTDYQAPYTFTLPSTHWADGSYTLAAEVQMRDGFISQRANLPVEIKNGSAAAQPNTTHFQPTSGTKPADGAPFVVVAAGDGASGENNSDKVTGLISALNPNLLLYLGDVYEKGSVAEFYNYYGVDGSWFSAFRDITDPTIGNHEYTSGSAAGYFDYWDNIPNYYSVDAGGWHIVSLNSNVSYIGVNGKSAQYLWLAADLAAHANQCTIVFYHQPLYNIGAEGETPRMSDIWALMAKDGVSIVLNGHDHDYQRWVPLDGSGQPSPGGITEFVVGTAGHGLQTFIKTDPRVAFSDDKNPEAFGVLKLSLSGAKAEFSFINTSNTTLDSGSIACNKAGGEATSQPATPAGSTATPSGVAPTLTLAPTGVMPVETSTPTGAAATSIGPASQATATDEPAPTIATPTLEDPAISFLAGLSLAPRSTFLILTGLAILILIGLFLLFRRH